MGTDVQFMCNSKIKKDPHSREGLSLLVVPPGPESMKYGISCKANIICLNINKYNT